MKKKIKYKIGNFDVENVQSIYFRLIWILTKLKNVCFNKNCTASNCLYYTPDNFDLLSKNNWLCDLIKRLATEKNFIFYKIKKI